MGTDALRASEVLPHRERLPHTRLSVAVRRGFARLQRAISWLWLLLMIVVVANVISRYLFGEGRVEFEEIQWHLFSIGFLVGLSIAMDSDDHIRVDVFHERLDLRLQAWIELYGLLLLFFPFVVAMCIFSLPFVAYAYEIGEVSMAPGGLPYRWLIKSMLPVAMLLLAVAGISRLSRVTACLFGWPRHVA